MPAIPALILYAVQLPNAIYAPKCEDYVLLEGAGMPVEPGTRGVRQETTEGPVHMKSSIHHCRLT